MISETIEPRVYGLFAELLDYPRSSLATVAEECAGLAGRRSPEAEALLRQFEAFAASTLLERLQEIYTSVFDLNATCHPYVGYHLFGESYKRSVFLLELKERYRPHGINSGIELPDHLPVMLRYLAANRDAGQAEELIREALLPALAKMMRSNTEDEPADRDSPRLAGRHREYQQVLQALRLALQTIAPDLGPAAVEGPLADLVEVARDYQEA